MTARLPLSIPKGRAVLDPATQTSLFITEDGQVIELGKHGTNKSTSTTSYSGGGDGTDPQPQVADDSTTDYEQD